MGIDEKAKMDRTRTSQSVDSQVVSCCPHLEGMEELY